jgi:mono/diheme cytochrome c family protein
MGSLPWWPALANHARADSAQIERGEYLVNLLSCGSCHTDGMLTFQAPGAPLAGSTTGIAYTDGERPGMIFPRNLTPDPESGLGGWSEQDIVRVLQSGVKPGGHQILPVMPWPGYAFLLEGDSKAIAAYLKSLEPVRSNVPENVSPGQTSRHPYVRYSIFVFQPGAGLERLGLPRL